MNDLQKTGFRSNMVKCLVAISLFFAGISFSAPDHHFQDNLNHWKQTEQRVPTSVNTHRRAVSLKKAFSAFFSPAKRVTFHYIDVINFNRLIQIKFCNLSKQAIPVNPAYRQIPARISSPSSDEDDLNA